MHTHLTKEQIESYRVHGFLALERLLEPDELREWREAVEETVAARTTRLPTGDVEAQGLDEATDVFTQRLNLWRTSTRIRDLVLAPRLGSMIAELEGLEAVRLYHDQALFKEPCSAPTPWHQDMPYFSFTSCHCSSVWIALADATIENGCLCYVPGSHTDGPGAIPAGTGLGALFDDHPSWRQVAPVFCPVPAGGAIFHNGLTAHAGGSNLTNTRRLAMTCAFMPADAAFDGNQNILTDAELAALRVGDPLDDAERWPLVFRDA